MRAEAVQCRASMAIVLMPQVHSRAQRARFPRHHGVPNVTISPCYWSVALVNVNVRYTCHICLDLNNSDQTGPSFAIVVAMCNTSIRNQ